MHQFTVPLEITGFVVETNDVVAFQIDFSVDGLVWTTYDQVGKRRTILLLLKGQQFLYLHWSNHWRI